MSTKEDLLKVWTSEAERIKRETVGSLDSLVHQAEDQLIEVKRRLDKLVADWELASEGLTTTAFDLLAKGGQVLSFEWISDKGASYAGRSNYMEIRGYRGESYQLSIPLQRDYRIIVLVVPKP